MQNSFKVRHLAIAATLALSAAGATAQSALEGWSVYAGGAYADVRSRADPLFSVPELLPPGAQAGVKVGDASTVAFGVVYKFTPNWSVELAIGVPPEHSGYGTDFIEPFGQISTVKQVAPTAFVNYHFVDVFMPGLSPFVGIGANYTRFTDATSTASGNAAGGGPTSINLSSSFGYAVHAGVAYHIDRNWSIVGAIAYADISSDLTTVTTTNSGNIVRTTTIDFRPIVYTLAVGYAF